MLDELAADLKDGSYRPLAARRVFIPKPGRPTEQRPLSIPAVRDRIVQTATRIVIEPIFEADFLPCSFGFRPRRSQHDALQVLIDEAWDGRRWVAESDVADCFVAIPHSGLMSVVEERIYHDAGADTSQGLRRGELLRLIREAGREPVERDTQYNRVVRDETAFTIVV